MPKIQSEGLPATEGLSSAQAASLLSSVGYNELMQGSGRDIWGPILQTLREPMILLLIVSATIYTLLGDAAEAALLGGSALIVIMITLVQEIRSNRALSALRDLASPRALVLRDGRPQRIPSREVVPGDVLILSEGDRVTADAEVVSTPGIAVDESLVSGESVPVEKSATGEPVTSRRIFSGSLVVRGSALARVTATGTATEIGTIGEVLATKETPKTPLQRETARLVQLAAIAGIGFCLIVTAIYGITRGDWVQASLAGIALAMSLLPEEFPVILSIFLALGARRLASKGMLVHTMPAVEGLGTVTVLCVDKTGTLTMNAMTLQAITSDGNALSLEKEVIELSAAERHLIEIAQLATKFPAWDPMDRAVQEAALRQGIEAPRVSPTTEIPISAELPAMFHGYAEVNDTGIIAVKGMPETIVGLCNLGADRQAGIRKQLETFALGGMRVLAVAESNSLDQQRPLQEHTLAFLGLLAFQDPLRPGVPQAVRECYEAGIRVAMITGDYPVTATTIAREAGIRNADAVITGEELANMTSDQLSERLATTNVFARIKPIQKLQIVEALKAAGEIVAMTGDGINDAPALKAAHIGVAMGARGTDVAREAAAVVLTKDDFPSLVGAIRLGRRTYDNIKKAMYYVLAMHVPIAGLSILPLLFGLPIIFYPIHIVLLELIIDPISSIVFEAEAEEVDVMRRPPRDPRLRMFRGSNVAIALLQGVSVLLMVAAIYFVAYQRTHSEFESRTLAFSTLVLANLMLALVNRSWSRTFLSMLKVRNTALWWCMAAGIVLLLLITTVPVLSSLFHFGPFHWSDWIVTAGAAAVSLTWFELLKLFHSKLLKS